jgi:hypothetical protein
MSWCLPIYPIPIRGLPSLGSWVAQHSAQRARFLIGNSRAPLPGRDLIGPYRRTRVGVRKHYVNTAQNTKTQKGVDRGASAPLQHELGRALKVSQRSYRTNQGVIR